MLTNIEIHDAASPAAPVVIGNFVIGSISEINGADSRPCPAYVPTRHELQVLARHWLEIDLDIATEFAATGQTGSSEWREQVYANQRLSLLAPILGDEELDRIVDEVQQAWQRRCIGK